MRKSLSPLNGYLERRRRDRLRFEGSLGRGDGKTQVQAQPSQRPGRRTLHKEAGGFVLQSMILRQ